VAKATRTQRDFSFGVTIPELLEGDDLEMRGQSVRDALNVRATAGRTARARMGTTWVFSLEDGVKDIVEVDTSDGQTFAVVVGPTSLKVLNQSYIVVSTETSVPWSASDTVWTAPFGDVLMIGFQNGLYALDYDGGDWTFGEVQFDETPGTSRAQPYWAYNPGITITPSDYTGDIIVTSSAAVFNVNYVGTRIRYAEEEILVTTYLSPTQIRGTVVGELPPTYDLTLPDVSGFYVGHVVVSDERGWQGIITAVDTGTKVITCVTLEEFRGPTTSETISSPKSSQSPSVVTKAAAPAGTDVWDEQLMSAVRGYARSGASVNGRLALCDFPEVPDLIAISSARSFTDFEVGLDDDDAIVRQAGNNSPRFRHVVPALDLILLSDRGCYYVKTRDGELLTPSNFQAIQFDQRSANAVRPELVDSAVIFVEPAGQGVSACVLEGNVYLSWRVIEVSRFSSHLFSSPTDLCGPVQSTQIPEKYLLVTNDDGSIVAMSWSSEFGSERAGFFPWGTTGDFVKAMPLFDAYHVIARRTVNGADAYYLERFDVGAVMDCSVTTSADINGSNLATTAGVEVTDSSGDPILARSPSAAHLAGATVGLWEADTYHGSTTLSSTGAWTSPPSVSGEYQIGLPFRASLSPWPVEIIDSPRLGMLKARVIQVSASVLNTVSFSCLRNSTTTKIPAYRPEDDAGAAPPRKTDVFKFSVYGNRAHPEIEFFSDEPGPFEIAAITQEVQV
jgi:hypothetical protein